MTKRLKVIFFALSCALLWTAINANAQQIAVWNDTTKSYVAVKAGNGIKVDLVAKTISATAVATKPRVFNAVLAYDTLTQCWPVPGGAVPASVAVTVNGLRYLPGIDYTVETSASWPGQSILKAGKFGSMPADSLVVVDYDQQ
jgi:hypothetical protein